VAAVGLDLWADAAAILGLHQLFELRQPVAVALTAHAPADMSLASTGKLAGPAMGDERGGRLRGPIGTCWCLRLPASIMNRPRP